MRKLIYIFLLIPCLLLGARDTDVRLAAYAGGHSVSTTLTISSVSWGAGDSGTITLSATVPAGTDTGYVITDTGSNSYWILSFSGAVITAQDFDSTTDPVTGGATSSITAPYSTIQSWEDDLDVTTTYQSGDTATILVYNGGGAYDEPVLLDGGSTVGLALATITVPFSDRHDGTAGTGSRIVATATGINFHFDNFSQTYEVRWLELDRNGQDIGGVDEGIIKLSKGVDSATERAILANLIIHDGLELNRDVAAISINTNPGDVTVMNTFIYDIRTNATDGDNILGVGVLGAAGVNDTIRILNVSVLNVTNNGGSGFARGIDIPDNGANVVRNSISMDTNGTSSGSIVDFEPATYSNASVSHNIASDATASGTGSLDSETSSDIFVSTTGGSEDLHLKSGSNAIDAGTAETFPVGVNTDIDGEAHDTGSNREIGADKFVAASSGDFSPGRLPQIIKNGDSKDLFWHLAHVDSLYATLEIKQ